MGTTQLMTGNSFSTVLAVGEDVISGSKTLLASVKLLHTDGDHETKHEFMVVYNESGGLKRGLFFTSSAMADVHFANITGRNKEICKEPSGGLLIREINLHNIYLPKEAA